MQLNNVKKKKDKIVVSKREMLDEHVHLLHILKNPTKKALLAEYLKQKKELPEYK